MEYTITIDNFEGPLDLLLHLIKQSDIDICDISILDITKQYMDYIDKMEELNLNIASEYLIMAAELLEMKSNMLLPKPKLEEDEYEEDPREKLIKRLLEYQHYKDITEEFKELELARKDFYTKEPSSLNDFKVTNEYQEDGNVDDLLLAFKKFLERKELEKPLNTKITTKEYSVSVRSNEIRNILKNKNKVYFEELFEDFNKTYIVVTFLSILDLARKGELTINQESNFEKIYLLSKGCE
ncbi:MAG: segregation/condensation protein A [Firmicutes bacterium]|nr:segregation/condensation protein A [Bacillota bacterium]